MRLERIFGENYIAYLKIGFKWALFIIVVQALLTAIFLGGVVINKEKFVGGDEKGFSFGLTKVKILDVKQGESMTLGTTFGPVFYLFLIYIFITTFLSWLLIYLAIKKSSQKFLLDTYGQRINFVFYICFYLVLLSSIIESVIAKELTLSGANLGTLIALFVIPAITRPKIIQQSSSL